MQKIEHTEDQRVADGDEGITATEHQAIDDLLDERCERGHPLPPHSLAESVDLRLQRYQIRVALKRLTICRKRSVGVSQRFMASREIDIGDGVPGRLRDGLAVRVERLAVALLLVVHETEIVIGLGIRGAERDRPMVRVFGFVENAERGIGETEE